MIGCVRSESEWNDWILIDRIDYIFIQVQRAWCPFGLAPSSWPFRDSPFEKGNRLINLINYYINWSLIYFFITLPLDQFSSCDLVINFLFLWSCNQSNNSLKILWEKSGDAIYITPPKNLSGKIWEECLKKPCGKDQSNSGILGKKS